MSGMRGRGARRLAAAATVLAVLALLPLPAAALAPAPRGILPIDVLPPVGIPDAMTTVHDRAKTVPPPGVLGNDLDLDGGATAVLDSQPSHGTVQLRSDGGYTYTPHAGYVGTDQFRYHARSLLLNSLSTPVNITVTNVVPVAIDDAYTGTSGQTLAVPAPGVLKNDVDADGDPLRAELRGGISNGSIDFHPNGSFEYQPSGGFTGVTSFNYRVWDGAAWSLEATVVITMLPLATPPPTAAPTPPPTAAPTPPPTATPAPTPTPFLPTVPPSILPSIPPSILPSIPPILPTPRPTAPPTPRPNATPTPAPNGSSTPRPSDAPTAAPSATEPGPSASPGPVAVVTPGGPGPTPAIDDERFALPTVDFGPFSDGFTGVGAFGGFEWIVPAIVLTVPGLLLLVAIGAQALIGVVWVPMVRRHLAGVGLRRRRDATSRR